MVLPLRKEDHGVHGGHGYGEKNDDGQHLLDYAENHDIIITNTLFKICETHLIMYYNGSNASQIDYFLLKRQNLKIMLDTKVVPYETVTMQHRSVICNLRINPPCPGYSARNGP
ncbi:uncharacterized protein LOC124776823 [Schistocerca piceifrons]|uniref:uncharacterized protein LOC124776823 n=1 Tax=Schistocerca piceifrons TaxID=274613 RepID=UPI001F5F4C02|nr:uncharacterized protein LOC124776823 [Schistocerca piceifrons]